MKKSTKALVLALAVFSTISLSSCAIQTKEDFLIEYTYKPAGSDKEITANISAQDMLDHYISKNGSAAAKTYYDAIYATALRKSFADGEFKEYKPTIDSKVKEKIANAKDQADKNDMSWFDYLTNNLGYKDELMDEAQKEEAYRLDSELEAMKTRISDLYYEEFKEWKTPETPDEDYDKYNMVAGENGYLKTKLPYQVRHVLVKNEADATDYTTGAISEDNAIKLSRVINKMTKTSTTSKTFSDIAYDESDDNAKTNRGEYLMDLSTSFIKEFKLGVYTYEALFNNATKSNQLVEKFNIPTNVEGELKEIGVNYIPVGAVEALKNVADQETVLDANGNEVKVNEGKSEYFPRNVLFSKYFNSHNVGFIVNYDIAKTDPTYEYTATDTGLKIKSDINNDGTYDLGTPNFYKDGTVEATHFAQIDGLKYPVLCDESGNPIITVRSDSSSGGVHFIVVEKSPLQDDAKSDVKLNEYFAPVNPLTQNGQDAEGNKYLNHDFPVDAKNQQLKTYVNTNIITTVEGYNSRVTSLKEKYETFSGSKKEFQLFDWITNSVGDLTFQAKDLKVNTLVDQYILQQKLSIDNSSNKALINDWEGYLAVVSKQQEDRKVGLIPETCALNFGNKDYYGVGKLCHYSSELDQK